MTQGRETTGQQETGADETLAEAFRSVARQLRETSQETLAPWDITPSHFRALRVLKRHGVMRLSDLSEHLHIAARSTTEVVDALESRDLVERRTDPADRRVDAIRAARGTEAERVFGRLSQTDRAHLARILRKLQS